MACPMLTSWWTRWISARFEPSARAPELIPSAHRYLAVFGGLFSHGETRQTAPFLG